MSKQLSNFTLLIFLLPNLLFSPKSFSQILTKKVERHFQKQREEQFHTMSSDKSHTIILTENYQKGINKILLSFLQKNEISPGKTLYPGDIMGEGFEENFPGAGWSLFGSPVWRTTNNRAHWGSFSVWCPQSNQNKINTLASNTAEAWMIYGPFKLNDAGNFAAGAILNFYIWVDIEVGDTICYLASKDGFYFSGPYTAFNTTLVSDKWEGLGYNLADFFGNEKINPDDALWIGFLFISKNNDPEKGFFIDDIRLIPTGSPSWQSIDFPGGNGLESVYFIDGNTGWVVGQYGMILKTTNGGNNWIKQASNTNVNLFSTHFVNKSTGWAVGENSYILKTINGGDTWIPQRGPEPGALYSIFFIDEHTGWAVGSYVDTTDKRLEGLIAHTNNGGENWILHTIETEKALVDVFFVDEKTGWVVGFNSFDWNIYNYHDAIVLKTIDSGNQWIDQTADIDRIITSVYFIDEQTGWLVGGDGAIYKTEDGGDNWILKNSGVPMNLWSVYFVDSNTGWAVGDDGAVLKTIDSGQTWTGQISGTYKTLYSVNFPDTKTGYCVGYSYIDRNAPYDGIFLKTISGGDITSVTRLSFNSVPVDFILRQNYPNPFNSETLISYELKQESRVLLKIFNTSGQLIKTLVDSRQPIGMYSVRWNGKDKQGHYVSSGIYFYQLQTQGHIQTLKMLLIR